MIKKEPFGEVVIVVVSQTAFSTAQRICKHFPHFIIYSFAECIQEFRACIRKHYKAGKAIIALCATGIVIRSLALLLDKIKNDPPVLVMTEDGSYVIPLLGVKNGANVLARELEKKVGGQAAITSSSESEVRFSINLLYPQNRLKLLPPGKEESSISSYGARIRVDSRYPYFDNTHLPLSSDSDVNGKSSFSLSEERTFNVRSWTYVPDFEGCVFVVGLGPGKRKFRSVSVNQVLANADDILGYAPYIDLAAPFLPGQEVYKSSNGQEIERSRHALNLAAKGRKVVLVSSGDPGVYGMASTLFEVLEEDKKAIWNKVKIVVEPGISAAFAAASRLGAPLGHDFAIMSLSDNLKPWEIIEKRLRLSARADMVLVLYNPVSKRRQCQIKKAVAVLFEERFSKTFVALAHDVGRKDEKLEITTLEKLTICEITSRTVIFIGSTKSRILKNNGKEWLYTPRHYL